MSKFSSQELIGLTEALKTELADFLRIILLSEKTIDIADINSENAVDLYRLWLDRNKVTLPNGREVSAQAVGVNIYGCEGDLI